VTELFWSFAGTVAVLVRSLAGIEEELVWSFTGIEYEVVRSLAGVVAELVRSFAGTVTELIWSLVDIDKEALWSFADIQEALVLSLSGIAEAWSFAGLVEEIVTVLVVESLAGRVYQILVLDASSLLGMDADGWSLAGTVALAVGCGVHDWAIESVVAMIQSIVSIMHPMCD
jgi:hypothetical protein